MTDHRIHRGRSADRRSQSREGRSWYPSIPSRYRARGSLPSPLAASLNLFGGETARARPRARDWDWRLRSASWKAREGASGPRASPIAVRALLCFCPTGSEHTSVRSAGGLDPAAGSAIYPGPARGNRPPSASLELPDPPSFPHKAVREFKPWPSVNENGSQEDHLVRLLA